MSLSITFLLIATMELLYSKSVIELNVALLTGQKSAKRGKWVLLIMLITVNWPSKLALILLERQLVSQEVIYIKDKRRTFLH